MKTIDEQMREPTYRYIDWEVYLTKNVVRDLLEERDRIAHQAGIDEAETQVLQEIMDEVTLLHKRKEIDDNGFCKVRDLLHSKALQDNK